MDMKRRPIGDTNGTIKNGDAVTNGINGAANGIHKSANGTTSNGVQKTWTKEYPKDIVPHEVPSLVQIKNTIPARCFKPSLLWSLLYVVKDLAIVASLYGLLLGLESHPSLRLVNYFYIPVYWFLQGTMFWALFVLGHDCGHGSFSKHNLINDIVGTFLHTIILVPFYPWKLSHKHHHKNTGNIDKDEIFYPVRETYTSKGRDIRTIKPLGLGFGLGLSWFVYLIVGYAPRNVCHFNPLASIYIGHVCGCVLSVLSWFSWAALLSYAYTIIGTYSMVVHYLIPILVFSSWLVVVTFLHHHAQFIPWYSDDKWDYVRGQLSSVDRDYGWAHSLTHNIGTHQIHHMFCKIPHYHLEEATAAFHGVYPHLARVSKQRIMPAFSEMFELFESQRFIGDSTQVHYYDATRK